MERGMSILKQKDIVVVPTKVMFQDHGILFTSEEGPSGSLDEDRILLACLEKEEKGRKTPVRVPVEDVSQETEGRIFLGTIYGTQCEIRTDQIKMTAGKLLMEIVRHYPWLWVGDHECLDSKDPGKWRRLQEMVEQMRACSILFG